MISYTSRAQEPVAKTVTLLCIQIPSIASSNSCAPQKISFLAAHYNFGSAAASWQQYYYYYSMGIRSNSQIVLICTILIISSVVIDGLSRMKLGGNDHHPPALKDIVVDEANWFTSKSFKTGPYETGSIVKGRMYPSLLKSDNTTSSSVTTSAPQSSALVGLDGEPFVSVSPPNLNFGSQHLCIAKVLRFTIRNIHLSLQDISIRSVTTDNVQFHPALFAPKILDNEEALTIEIIYLPRTIGFSSANVVIKTNRGTLVYSVSGSGVNNDYGITAFAATLATGETYAPAISITNPLANESLMVEEIFTTEGFLHLNLPQEAHDVAASTTTQESSNALPGYWEVLPATTKKLINLSFLSSVSGVFDAYVHVKTNRHNLIIPVSLTVKKAGLSIVNPSAVPAVSSSNSVIDFGVLAAEEESHEIVLEFVNTGALPVQITGYFLSEPDPNLSILLINAKGPVILPSSNGKNSTRIKFLYHGGSAGDFLNRQVSFKTNDTMTAEDVDDTQQEYSSGLVLTVTYSARVIHGTISFRRHQTLFTPEMTGVYHELQFINRFNNTSVEIQDIRILNSTELVVRSYSKGAVLRPEDVGGRMASVKFDVDPSMLHIRHYILQIITNVSVSRVPLHVGFHSAVVSVKGENGIKSSLIEEKKNVSVSIDFGVMTKDEPRYRIVNFTNPNAHSVLIRRVDVLSPDILSFSVADIVMAPEASVEVSEVAKEWHDSHVHGMRIQLASANRRISVYQMQEKNNMTLPAGQEKVKSYVELPPGHTVMLSIRLQTLKVGASATDLPVLRFKMAKGNEVDVRATFETATGLIFNAGRRKRIRFSAAFPGKMELKPLVLQNTYMHDASILSLKFSSNIARAFITNPILKANSSTTVGMIALSPAYALACQDLARLADCTVPITGAQNLPELSSFGSYVTSKDLAALKNRKNRLARAIDDSRYPISIKMSIETDLTSQVSIPIQAKLMVPRLLPLVPGATQRTGLDFDQVAVGSIRQKYFNVSNPGNITMKFGLATAKEHKYLFVCQHDHIGLDLERDQVCMAQWKAQHTKVFYIPPSAYKENVLDPGDLITIGPVYFIGTRKTSTMTAGALSPPVNTEYNSVVYLRNDYTHIQPLHLSATVGVGVLAVKNDLVDVSFDNIVSKSVILFNVSSSNNESHARRDVNLKLANDGSLPLIIDGFIVGNDGNRCSDKSGFEVMNCRVKKSITLGVNETRNVALKYVSDCYHKLHEKNLTILSSAGNKTVRLVAALSAEAQHQCQLYRFSNPNLFELVLFLASVMTGTYFAVFGAVVWFPIVLWILYDAPSKEKVGPKSASLLSRKEIEERSTTLYKAVVKNLKEPAATVVAKPNFEGKAVKKLRRRRERKKLVSIENTVDEQVEKNYKSEKLVDQNFLPSTTAGPVVESVIVENKTIKKSILERQEQSLQPKNQSVQRSKKKPSPKKKKIQKKDQKKSESRINNDCNNTPPPPAVGIENIQVSVSIARESSVDDDHSSTLDLIDPPPQPPPLRKKKSRKKQSTRNNKLAKDQHQPVSSPPEKDLIPNNDTMTLDEITVSKEKEESPLDFDFHYLESHLNRLVTEPSPKKEASYNHTAIARPSQSQKLLPPSIDSGWSLGRIQLSSGFTDSISSSAQSSATPSPSLGPIGKGKAPPPGFSLEDAIYAPATSSSTSNAFSSSLLSWGDTGGLFGTTATASRSSSPLLSGGLARRESDSSSSNNMPSYSSNNNSAFTNDTSPFRLSSATSGNNTPSLSPASSNNNTSFFSTTNTVVLPDMSFKVVPSNNNAGRINANLASLNGNKLLSGDDGRKKKRD